MSGHNKWSKIKHKKAANDAKRGKMFTKILREITVAAKTNGVDSAKVSLLISKGRAINLPNELLKRALTKATDKSTADDMKEISYEAYGPGGVAMVIDALTENRNRTIADIRHMVSKGGGNMAESGSVLWQFETKGQLSFEKSKTSEEELFEKLLDAGVEDIDASDDEMLFVTCEPGDLMAVRDAAEAAGLEAKSVELERIPKNTIQVNAKATEKVLSLMDKLEDLDDVQSVSSNIDIPDDFEVVDA
jgi:YebC/PmpR family DNA-binding regulatory protein